MEKLDGKVGHCQVPLMSVCHSSAGANNHAALEDYGRDGGGSMEEDIGL